MTKTRGGIVKRFVPKPSKNKKRKAEEISRSSKKIVVEELKSNSDSDTMVEIDNYEDRSAQATNDVESSEEKTNRGDEESSRDSRDTRDEDDDPLSLPICAREISGFPHLGKYAKKSLDSPLPIPHLLRWHMTKSNNIIEGDPFKYKGRNTKKNKDDNLCERVASLELSMMKIVAFIRDEKLRRAQKNKKNDVDDGEILLLPIVDEDLVAVTYFVEEVNEVVEDINKGEKEQKEEKMEEKQEKLEEKKQEKERMEEKEKKLEEKKKKEVGREENKEEEIEVKKEEEKKRGEA
ncbi:hypothetical protein H5410_036548 [Solanum commersonii]|uniref:Uncharacterized protein n=1 Tax=Solanum commersonii TaxID=4109 RepID=A0A9J5Y7S1_SOLCO|nr:hypothetical protein H5410_036548 [Solanum commersonii]